MSDDVRQVFPPDADEAWERLTDDPDVRGVEAARIDEIGGWQVTVSVMEFLREDPLEAELRRRMAALRAVDGVATADEQDREIWFVTGTPSGKALTQAAAQVIDDLADRSPRIHASLLSEANTDAPSPSASNRQRQIQSFRSLG